MLKKLYISAFFMFCLTELMNSAASMTDAFFIGNFVGSPGMAAVSFARPFFSFVSVISGLLGLGMQLVCSNYIGKGSIDHAQRVFSCVFQIGLIVSLLLTGLGFSGAGRLSLMYGKESLAGGVSQLAEGYLKGLFVGVPAMVTFGVLSPIVQLGNGKRKITASVVLQFAADVAGDVLNEFVFHGGMFGFGIATAVSYYFSLIPLILYFLHDDAILKLKPAELFTSDLKNIFLFGRSKSISSICSTVKPILLNALSLLLGTSLTLSAYAVTNQIRDILISYSAGTAGAALLIGALLYGQRDRDGLRALSELSFAAVAFSTVLGAICVIFARPLAAAFIRDSEEVLSMAALSLRCVGIMIPLATFNGLFIAFMNITRRFGLVDILSCLNRLILIVLASAVLGYFFGTDGLWWALPVSEAMNIIILLFLVRHYNGAFPKKAADWLCLAPDFGFRPEDYIELSVKNAEDVTALLDVVGGFCRDHGIDPRRSFFTQLALEELAMNVIEHGFPRCRREPIIHIWITCDNGDMKIRIQDNCPGFNVMKCCSELQQQSRERCVGLRIVSKISKEMNYMNILETNNLMITV